MLVSARLVWRFKADGRLDTDTRGDGVSWEVGVWGFEADGGLDTDVWRDGASWDVDDM